MARRGVWELKEIQLVYSPISGSSKGVVDFVRTRLGQWARSHPQFQIKTKIRTLGHPYMCGLYRNNHRRLVTLRNEDASQVEKMFEMLKNRLGHKLDKHNQLVNKPFATENETVTGVYTVCRSDIDNLQLALFSSYKNERQSFGDLADKLGPYGMVRFLSMFENYQGGGLKDLIMERNPDLLSKTAAGTPIEKV